MWIDIKTRKILKWFMIIFEITGVAGSVVCMVLGRVDIAIYCLMMAFYAGRGYE